MTTDFIKIRGARQHNLKNLSLDIPRNKLVVITGLSGSGKSSLAFDTIYAEGQRRYVESLSAYARQFLQIMARPNVDLLAGIPPTVAIEQRLSQGGRNSTVATVTGMIIIRFMNQSLCRALSTCNGLACAPLSVRASGPAGARCP